MSTTPGRKAGAAGPWRWHTLLLAPHRLGFFLAMVVLVAASVWWAAVQAARSGWLALPPPAVAPSIVHGAVMVFGFFPLFFGGFLFTGGVRWLRVPAPPARAVAPGLCMQAAGWLLWLAGAFAGEGLALAGLAFAALGLAATAGRFAALLRQSAEDDRAHAKAVLAALSLGCLHLAGLGMALVLGTGTAAQALLVGGMWGCVALVFVAAAHRLLPFFTSAALPHADSAWLLWLMLGSCLFEAGAAWADAFLALPAGWAMARGAAELACGTVLLWVAVRWARTQSMKARLTAMLHAGFCWLGLAMCIAGADSVLAATTAAPAPLPLAALHALGMGCCGSLMLAMVTRVSAGHSGRAQIADGLVWNLFRVLQAATVLRVAAAALASQGLLLAAAWLWCAIVTLWALRLVPWYGRPRPDGRPG